MADKAQGVGLTPNLEPATISHSDSHEFTGGDIVRLSIQSDGVSLAKFPTLNFGDGIKANEDPDNQRITVDVDLSGSIVENTNHDAAASGNLSLGTDAADVTGASVTLVAVGTYLIIISAELEVNNCTGNARLYMGGPVEPRCTLYAASGITNRSTHTMSYVVATGSANTVAKIQGWRSGAGAGTIYSANTIMHAILLS